MLKPSSQGQTSVSVSYILNNEFSDNRSEISPESMADKPFNSLKAFKSEIMIGTEKTLHTPQTRSVGILADSQVPSIVNHKGMQASYRKDRRFTLSLTSPSSHIYEQLMPFSPVESTKSLLPVEEEESKGIRKLFGRALTMKLAASKTRAHQESEREWLKTSSKQELGYEEEPFTFMEQDAEREEPEQVQTKLSTGLYRITAAESTLENDTARESYRQRVRQVVDSELDKGKLQKQQEITEGIKAKKSKQVRKESQSENETEQPPIKNKSLNKKEAKDKNATDDIHTSTNQAKRTSIEAKSEISLKNEQAEIKRAPNKKIKENKKKSKKKKTGKDRSEENLHTANFGNETDTVGEVTFSAQLKNMESPRTPENNNKRPVSLKSEEKPAFEIPLQNKKISEKPLRQIIITRKISSGTNDHSERHPMSPTEIFFNTESQSNNNTERPFLFSPSACNSVNASVCFNNSAICTTSNASLVPVTDNTGIQLTFSDATPKKASKRSKVDQNGKKKKKKKKTGKREKDQVELEIPAQKKPKKEKNKPSQNKKHKSKQVILTDGLNIVKVLINRQNRKMTKFLCILFTIAVVLSFIPNSWELYKFTSTECAVDRELPITYIGFGLMAFLKIFTISLFNLELTFIQPYQATYRLLSPLIIFFASALLQIPQNIYDFDTCQSTNYIVDLQNSWNCLEAIVCTILSILLLYLCRGDDGESLTDYGIIIIRIYRIIKKIVKLIVLLAILAWNVLLVIAFIGQRSVFKTNFFVDFCIYFFMMVVVALLCHLQKIRGEKVIRDMFVKPPLPENQPLRIKDKTQELHIDIEVQDAKKSNEEVH